MDRTHRLGKIRQSAKRVHQTVHDSSSRCEAFEVTSKRNSKFHNSSPYRISILKLMAFTNPSSTRSKRAMAARKEFEEAWTEAGKMFASPQDGSKAGSKGKKASQLSYRREESPGGTVHEYYADGTEKIPDESTSKPIRLGQRIVLGYANRAPVEGLVAMHRIFGNESDRLNATFETNDSDPEVEFLNRAALRALPEE